MSKLNKLANQAKKTQRTASFTEDSLKNFTAKVDEQGVVETVAVSKIKYNPANDYRQNDSEESINSLAQDIARQGLLHNLVVSERINNGQTDYILISGERRLRAINKLIQIEVDKINKGLSGDPGKYQTVNCRVVKNLTPRQEMIMLDAANLQTRGGAGEESSTRKAMTRYRENVMAEYSLTSEQVRSIIVDMSPVGFTTVNSNFIIEDNLRSELKDMLDSNEINKKQALSFAKLPQDSQKVISDAILTVKQSLSDKQSECLALVKQSIKEFFEASEQTTDDAIEKEIKNADAKIREQIKNSCCEKEEKTVSIKKAQRDIMLMDCAVIEKKIKRLSTQKAVANIRRFDLAAESDEFKIALKIDSLITELTNLKALIEGEQ